MDIQNHVTHLALNLVPETLPLRRETVADFGFSSHVQARQTLSPGTRCGAPDKMRRGFHIHILSLGDIQDPVGK